MADTKIKKALHPRKMSLLIEKGYLSIHHLSPPSKGDGIAPDGNDGNDSENSIVLCSTIQEQAICLELRHIGEF